MNLYRISGLCLLAGCVLGVAAVSTVRVVVPTATAATPSPAVVAAEVETPTVPPDQPKWAGFEQLEGSPVRGRELFLTSPAIACNGCHSLEPQEVWGGPSLAGVGSRLSRQEIAESITQPSAQIAPGYPTHFVLTTDGQRHEGRLEAETIDVIVLRLESRDEMTIPRADIEAIRRMESGMPQDAAAELSPQELADIVAFLGELGDSLATETAMKVPTRQEETTHESKHLSLH